MHFSLTNTINNREKIHDFSFDTIYRIMSDKKGDRLQPISFHDIYLSSRSSLQKLFFLFNNDYCHNSNYHNYDHDRYNR